MIRLVFLQWTILDSNGSNIPRENATFPVSGCSGGCSQISPSSECLLALWEHLDDDARRDLIGFAKAQALQTLHLKKLQSAASPADSNQAPRRTNPSWIDASD